MQQLDVILRAGGGVLTVGLALILLARAPRERIFRLFLPLSLGAAGFLAINTPETGLQLSGAPGLFAAALSGNSAVFLWWFCLSIFDDDFRLGRLELGVGAAWFVIFLADRTAPHHGFGPPGYSWLLIPFGFAMVVHLAWRVVRDRGGDLIESRRRSRLLAVAALATVLAVDLAVDVMFGVGWKPQGFTVTQNALIVLVALGLAAWLVRPNPELLSAGLVPIDPEAPYSGLARTRPVAPSAETRLLRRLNDLMTVQRIYLDPRLTFERFVQAMGAPEAVVRRLINRQLGYRHFRGFLNAYRVRAARQALADPARSGEKMSSIAFDAGFASLASFNRAFKLVEGRSPSDCRATPPRSGRLPVPTIPERRKRRSALESGL